jgi:outer membrane protein OmpA-like peptidoglycan-associated protein
MRTLALLTLTLCVVCASVVFATPAALAQSSVKGFALNRFDPSERGSEWFVLDSLDFRGHSRFALGTVADYGYKPLVFRDENGKEQQALIKHQLFIHLGASLLLWERLRLAADLPIAALVDGQPGVLNGQLYDVDKGAALGDLRISADVRVFGKYRGLASGSFGLSVWLPTGSRAAYTSDGKVRLAPHFNLAGEVAVFAYALKLGFNVRLQDDQLAGASLGSEVFGAGSMGLRLANGKLLLGPEIYFSTVVKDGAFRAKGTPFEGIFGAHYWIARVVRIGAGVGPGFTEGFGSPKVRAVASLEWVPDAPEPDRDHDGIFDKDDACPDEPGVRSDDPKKNGCPLRDRDRDTILDEDDACPDEPGVRSDDPAKNGCPIRDRDGDRILDDDDACPDLPGVANPDPKKNGCPDTDGDTIIDPEDACPTAAGPPNEDPKKHGCPIARVEQGQIRILEQVKFKTDSAEILGESNYILDAVSQILIEHAEIGRISIEGHTDNVGAPAYNKGLSQRRAASVMSWLIAHGIDASRLSSAGFGLELPIADNDSEEGRRVNRRVEFHIREVSGKPADDRGERNEE